MTRRHLERPSLSGSSGEHPDTRVLGADGFKPDRKTDNPGKRRPLARPLWLHPDVSDRLREWGHLYRRLGVVLEQLAAHGRTGIVKGCRHANRGWRRSPLGGGNGLQYYLWWTVAGAGGPVESIGAEPGTIVIRTVRHHDDHRHLRAGRRRDYLAVVTSEDITDDIAGRPWTAAQQAFGDDQTPVRVLRGRPGSGKTTALWRAIKARDSQRVLYLTWSQALTRHAEEHLNAFAAASVDVKALDFRTLVGELVGRDVEAAHPAESLERIGAATRRLGRQVCGPWHEKEQALYAELRGRLLGRGAAGEADSESDGRLVRLKEAAYVRQRGNERGVGSAGARALFRLLRALDKDTIEKAFPELAAAKEAAARLEAGSLPPSLACDRVVVDELQDLTLTEFAVVIELLRANRRHSGRSPWLLLAGDAGQRVHASGFEWGRYGQLLAARWKKPATFDLNEHVRCPRRIAEVVDHSSSYYTWIDKDRRPGKQQEQHGAQHVEAQVLSVRVAAREEGQELVERLGAVADLAVLSATNELPAWLSEANRKTVLTPAEAKGLDYQHVCVLDAGAAVLRWHSAGASGPPEPVRQESVRTEIDQLRVSLSRATETLVLVNVEPTPDAELETMALGCGAMSYSADDLIEHFDQRDTTPEERILSRTREAERLLERKPARAWQVCCQAMAMLGDPELPNGVWDQSVRDEARTTGLRVACALVVDKQERHRCRNLEQAMQWVLEIGAPPPPIDDEDSDADYEHGAPYTRQSKAVSDLRVIRVIERHLTRTLLDKQPFDTPRLELLECLAVMKGRVPARRFWPDRGLAQIRQALQTGLIRGARDPDWAKDYHADDVTRWLLVTGYGGDAADQGRRLWSTAIETLLDAAEETENPASRKRYLNSIEDLLDRVEFDRRLLGRLEEARGRTKRAIAAYKEVKAHADVARVLRKEADWEAAAALEPGDEHGDLAWLLEVEALAKRRPEGQQGRLHEKEHERLRRTLARMGS